MDKLANGKSGGRANGECARCRALFSGAYDDEFGVGERDAFYHHLKQCAGCRREFAAYRQALMALKAVEHAPAAAGFDQRVLGALTREAGHSTVVALATEPAPTRPIPRTRMPLRGRFISLRAAAAAAFFLAAAAAFVTYRLGLVGRGLTTAEAVPAGYVRVGNDLLPVERFVTDMLEAQGYVRVGSRWAPRDEAQRAAEGRVFYAGRWVTPAELKEAVFKAEGLVKGERGWEMAGAFPPPVLPSAAAPPAAPPERAFPIEESMRALGYEKVGDRWVTAQEKGFIEKGFVYYDGRWVAPADLKRDLLELEGLVTHDGRWMTREQREMLVASSTVERPPSASARNEVTAVVEALAIGDPSSQDAFTVYPLYARVSVPETPAVSLEAALRVGKFELRDEKHTRRLKARNSGDRPVLLLAGELLAGGTQDRVVARDTVVVPDKSRWADLPVYCAEPGRSAGKADRFDPVGAIVATDLRRLLALDGMQAEVWSGVRRQLEGMEVKSPTDALSAAYAHRAYQERLTALGQRLGDLPARDGRTIGVVVGVDRELALAEIFPSNALFREAYPKVLAAAASQAFGRRPAATAAAALPNTRAAVKQLLEASFSFEYVREKEDAGGGYLIRSGDVVVGQASLHEGRVCHAVLYPTAPPPTVATGGRPAAYALDPEKARRLAAEFERTMATAGEEERLRAVQEFGAVRWDKVAEALAPFVANDASDAVRVALVERLGATGSPQAVKPLADLLEKLRRKPALAKAAAEALARSGDPRAADPLFKLLHHPDPESARVGLDACAQLIVNLRDRQAIEKAMTRLIAFYEVQDLHALEVNPTACVTHGLYRALYEPLHVAMLRLTEYNYPSGAKYRGWWNENKEAFLRKRTGPP